MLKLKLVMALGAMLSFGILGCGGGSQSNLASSTPASSGNSGANSGSAPSGSSQPGSGSSSSSGSNPGSSNSGSSSGSGSGSNSGSSASSGSGNGSGGSGSGSSSSGNGTGSGSASGGESAPAYPTVAFVAALLSGSDNSNHGTVTVDLQSENGSSTVQLQNAKPNSVYSVMFCPFPTNSGPMGNDDCGAVAPNLVTDTGGNATASFQFNRHGTWSGVFKIGDYLSGFDMPSNGTEYQSALKQAKSITLEYPANGAGVGPIGSDTLSSGYVAVSGRKAHFTIIGAVPNAAYVAHYCANSSANSCMQLGQVQTDGSGSGAADIDYLSEIGNFSPPGIFYLSRTDQAITRSEFVSAFFVP